MGAQTSRSKVFLNFMIKQLQYRSESNVIDNIVNVCLFTIEDERLILILIGMIEQENIFELSRSNFRTNKNYLFSLDRRIVFGKLSNLNGCINVNNQFSIR